MEFSQLERVIFYPVIDVIYFTIFIKLYKLDILYKIHSGFLELKRLALSCFGSC
jgi:hypothetical protein